SIDRGERIEGSSRRVTERVVHLRKAIGVIGRAEIFLGELRKLTQIAASARYQCLAPIVGECCGCECIEVKQADTRLVVAPAGSNGAGIDDAAHAVAVERRKTARVEYDAVDQARVEQADR